MGGHPLWLGLVAVASATNQLDADSLQELSGTCMALCNATGACCSAAWDSGGNQASCVQACFVANAPVVTGRTNNPFLGKPAKIVGEFCGKNRSNDMGFTLDGVCDHGAGKSGGASVAVTTSTQTCATNGNPLSDCVAGAHIVIPRVHKWLGGTTVHKFHNGSCLGADAQWAKIMRGPDGTAKVTSRTGALKTSMGAPLTVVHPGDCSGAAHLRSTLPAEFESVSIPAPGDISLPGGNLSERLRAIEAKDLDAPPPSPPSAPPSAPPSETVAAQAVIVDHAGVVHQFSSPSACLGSSDGAADAFATIKRTLQGTTTVYDQSAALKKTMPAPLAVHHVGDGCGAPSLHAVQPLELLGGLAVTGSNLTVGGNDINAKLQEIETRLGLNGGGSSATTLLTEALGLSSPSPLHAWQDGVLHHFADADSCFGGADPKFLSIKSTSAGTTTVHDRTGTLRATTVRLAGRPLEPREGRGEETSWRPFSLARARTGAARSARDRVRRQLQQRVTIAAAKRAHRAPAGPHARPRGARHPHVPWARLVGLVD